MRIAAVVLAFLLRGVRLGRASMLLAALMLPALPRLASGQAQNPSPMVETTRAHERLSRQPLDGVSSVIEAVGGFTIDLFVPRTTRARPITLVLHFHGAAWLPAQAVTGLDHNAVSAVVNLGAGSAVYDRTFSDPAVFAELVRSVAAATSDVLQSGAAVERTVLTAFSAGHGAVRAILRDSAHFANVHAVLLLDGMHTSYVPPGSVLAEGAVLDTGNLTALARFARAAVAGEKQFLVTHSEIFPGTFASTTETADWLLGELGLRRTAVLEWGPVGMQQLSVARAGGFQLLGYAGNSAPDHIDHFHALPELLRMLLR
jgi:hypothetical protein